MNDKEVRLAIIYKRNDDGNYSFYSPTLVMHYSDDNYRVLTGDLSNACETVFSEIESKPSFIFGDKAFLSIDNNDDEKAFAIYIFDHTFIEDYSISSSLNTEESIYDIVRRANDVDLIYSNVEDCYCSVTSKLKNILSDKNIEDLLYKEGPCKISNSDKEVLNDFWKQVVHKTRYDFERKERENKEKKLNGRPNISPVLVKDTIDSIGKRIVGQDEAIKTLVSNIYFNQLLLDSLDDIDEIDRISELDSRKKSILLDGSTGTGKTAIVKEIANRMKIPLVIVNANSFSETGYVGPSITDILEKLLKEANGNIYLAQRGIVVLDEVDKIAVSNHDSRSMKLGVQKELLGFISGAKYEINSGYSFFSNKTVEFDTSQITFILSGAFTTLKEEKIRKNNKNNLGFSSKLDSEKRRVYNVTAQDYIDYGLMREFFGRIKILTTTKTYTKEDLKEILLTSEISPLTSFEKTVVMLGYPGITYSDKFIDEVVEEAYNMQTGARALQTILSGIQDTLLFDLITHKFKTYNEINLNGELFAKYKKRNVRKF